MHQYPEIEKALQEKLASDPHRPQYHFLPPANWMNDPNGLIQWQGKYHMFYQYNPEGPFHGSTIHWGHAVSEDLAHWTHLPIALTPTPGGPDADGCWSGCAVDNEGTPTLIYSGNQRTVPATKRQLPCIATTSSDDLVRWHKYPGNPVIAAPPADMDLVGFRDHSVCREDDTWYQVIGAGVRDVGGTALLYRSSDLIRWDYLGPILAGDLNQTDPVWTGKMWECPDLFALDDKHVLLVSVHDGRTLYTIYFIGTYTNHRFTPEILRKLDFGDNYFYAPQTMVDDNGRRLMWGWLQEGRSREAQTAAGWSGVMSLPRVLSIHPTGVLGATPAPELQMLRGEYHQIADIELTPASTNVLGDLQGDCLEMMAVLQPGEATQVGLKVRRSPDGEEETFIIYDREANRLAIDRERSSLSSDVERKVNEGPFELAADETLQLHIFLDRSVIEIFANERACLTSRIYPTRPDSLRVDLFARGGNAKLVLLDAWHMRSIWTSA